MTRKKKVNAPHAPRVTSRRIVLYAADHGIEIQRAGGTWYYNNGDHWIQFGTINYLALIQLQVIAARRKKAQP